MGQQNQDYSTPEPMEDLYEPSFGDLAEELLPEEGPASTEKQRLVQRRRLAEQRLEQKRLREELGYYDLELDEF